MLHILNIKWKIHTLKCEIAVQMKPVSIPGCGSGLWVSQAAVLRQVGLSVTQRGEGFGTYTVYLNLGKKKIKRTLLE